MVVKILTPILYPQPTEHSNTWSHYHSPWLAYCLHSMPPTPTPCLWKSCPYTQNNFRNHHLPWVFWECHSNTVPLLGTPKHSWALLTPAFIQPPLWNYCWLLCGHLLPTPWTKNMELTSQTWVSLCHLAGHLAYIRLFTREKFIELNWNSLKI